ncbi:hypothetical protein RD792_014490 [Penstemon davidsonii]|uniref:Zinc finger BED domain-containing protein RICESLEEPER 2-like n=1 Tax=Penstemon davidsonii TaxID=160366 RepID=A0ABR0CPG5_9LAMI|nr:hypothetical protein RD792_014490 [Penstemon davidsonii]
MREKFNKYWSNVKNMNEPLFIDVVLDLSYKMKYVTYWLNLMHGSVSLKGIEFVRNVENALNDLYYHYMGICESHGSQVRSDTPGSTTNNMEVDEVGDVMKFIESGFDKHLEQVDDKRNVSELSQYFGEPHEKREGAFDNLNWWKCRDVLAIPVSRVSSEQAFSTSGQILDPFRSSLDPKTVHALICAQSWLRSKPIDIVDAMEEIEKYEEMQEDRQSSDKEFEEVPETLCLTAIEFDDSEN